jgi:hypothetical protein
LSAERVERRLAAILAADVAGYSRLMERDEAGTLARLKTLRRDSSIRSSSSTTAASPELTRRLRPPATASLWSAARNL